MFLSFLKNVATKLAVSEKLEDCFLILPVGMMVYGLLSAFENT